jgi:hypothetical protein
VIDVKSCCAKTKTKLFHIDCLVRFVPALFLYCTFCAVYSGLSLLLFVSFSHFFTPLHFTTQPITQIFQGTLSDLSRFLYSMR